MPHQQSVTLLELMIVLIIIGLVSALGLVGWKGMLEREYADNAQIILKLLKDAEQNFFAWKGYYTDDTPASWESLEIDDPNNSDKFYDYEIETPAGKILSIKATRKNQETKWFKIDQDGNITSSE